MLTFIYCLKTNLPVRLAGRPVAFIGSAAFAAVEFVAEVVFLAVYFG